MKHNHPGVSSCTQHGLKKY